MFDRDNYMQKNIVPVTAFYDRIAAEYNRRMTASDKCVRQVVSRAFRQYIPAGNILDFGGGTGLDLPWLLDDDYRIFFLEPSDNMRAVAKRAAAATGAKAPVFIEGNTDIHDWSGEHLPCLEKMDGVLANFAVLNCIKEPEVFFEKIALVCGRHCHIIACVLDARPRILLKKYPVNVVMRGFFKGMFVVRNAYEEIAHETYIHFLQRFRNASRHHFDFTAYLPVAASDFALLIFSKK